MKVIRIQDDDQLWRRVDILKTEPSYYDRSAHRPTSLAFVPRKIEGILEEYISVNIERLTSYDGSIGDREIYQLYSHSAAFVRSLGLVCRHIPLVNNNAHAGIDCPIGYSQAKKLSRMASLVNDPNAV